MRGGDRRRTPARRRGRTALRARPPPVRGEAAFRVIASGESFRGFAALHQRGFGGADRRHRRRKERQRPAAGEDPSVRAAVRAFEQVGGTGEIVVRSNVRFRQYWQEKRLRCELAGG